MPPNSLIATLELKEKKEIYSMKNHHYQTNLVQHLGPMPGEAFEFLRLYKVFVKDQQSIMYNIRIQPRNHVLNRHTLQVFLNLSFPDDNQLSPTWCPPYISCSENELCYLSFSNKLSHAGRRLKSLFHISVTSFISAKF